MEPWKKIISFALVLGTGFLGGVLSNWVCAPKTAFADTGQILTAQRLNFVGPDGRNGGQVFFADGSGAMITLNAEDQAQRIQIGTYSGAGEKGLPTICLSDNKGNLRMLLRLAGPNESPVLVLKDRQHHDRVVLGLGLNDANEEPFMAYFDKDGNKHMVMGSY